MTGHAALQNRVAFLINNISPKNVDSKVNEMRDLISQELWPWFANYMVVKRAAQVRVLQVWTLHPSLLSKSLSRCLDPGSLTTRCLQGFTKAFLTWDLLLSWEA